MKGIIIPMNYIYILLLFPLIIGFIVSIKKHD